MNPLRRVVRRVANDEKFDALSLQIEAVREVAVETRRLVVDQLDASTEATALLARALADLQQAVEELRAEVAARRA